MIWETLDIIILNNIHKRQMMQKTFRTSSIMQTLIKIIMLRIIIMLIVMPLTLHAMVQLANIESLTVQCLVANKELVCSPCPIKITVSPSTSHLLPWPPIKTNITTVHPCHKYSAVLRPAAVLAWHRCRSKKLVLSIITNLNLPANHPTNHRDRSIIISVNRRTVSRTMSMFHSMYMAKLADLGN